MSKYYEAEDVINCVADVLAEEANMRGCKPLHAIYFKERAKGVLEDLPIVEIVFCEECKHAPYCEQFLVTTTFGDEISDGYEVDFCQHGERIEE